MVDLSNDNLSADEQEALPDTPFEHRVCGLTLTVSLFFLASGIYYLFSPPDDGFKTTLLAIAAGVFGITLIGFFLSAFTGKFCGQCAKHKG